MSSWRRLPSPQCSHIWGGTKCSTRLLHGTEDSALAARGRRTASAGLPGLRMLHLIDEQQLETLAERRDGGEVLAGGT